jgi:hypothetical protein
MNDYKILNKITSSYSISVYYSKCTTLKKYFF